MYTPQWLNLLARCVKLKLISGDNLSIFKYLVPSFEHPWQEIKPKKMADYGYVFFRIEYFHTSSLNLYFTQLQIFSYIHWIQYSNISAIYSTRTCIYSSFRRSKEISFMSAFLGWACITVVTDVDVKCLNILSCKNNLFSKNIRLNSIFFSWVDNFQLGSISICACKSVIKL